MLHPLIMLSSLQISLWTCLKKVNSTFKIINECLGGRDDPEVVYRCISKKTRSIGFEQWIIAGTSC